MEQQVENIEKSFYKDMVLKHKDKIAVSIFLACLTFWLLQGDSRTFLSWWLFIWVIGCCFMPFTGLLFSGFRDRGWLFSKVIGIAVSGYVTWLLVTVGILKFTAGTCLMVTLLCIGINFFFAHWQRQKKCSVYPVNEGNLIFWEEVFLFVAFLLWTYVAGFRPQAFGEEKFMDFGFMAAMMRSTELPATDIWYSQSHINYYYGGQYYAVFLTKVTGTQIASTYHLMRTLVAGMAFALPFSLVRQVTEDYFKKKFSRTSTRKERTKKNLLLQEKLWKRWSLCSGLLAGAAVSLAGNMHYVIYHMILPLVKTSEEDYWFSDSTRYIGHNPVTSDQVIHEFPSYSFIQGDLHAHVVNIFYVLTVVGLLYAWMKHGKYNRKEAFFQIPLLMCGTFLGIFQWSNAWDFAIYYVVICGVCFFGNLARFQDWKEGILNSVVQWIELLLLSLLVALPFTLKFDSGMAQGICLAKNHSAFYQLCILWGLPVTIVSFYLLKIFLENGKCTPLQWLERTLTADLFVIVLCLCALGLVVMPEIVYLKDIYEETAARSNTMFKLTYQAFILFGIGMGFILVRFLSQKCLWTRGCGILGTVCLLLTFCYTGTAISQWNGEVWNREGYQGLDATAFLETEFPGDASAIRWLQSKVSGTSVVLEAPGESYSSYCRVSAMTGLPTVQGWYVHEWLWRGEPDRLNEEKAQIETIYTSADEEQVRRLLDQYQVSYIFIGQMERENYPNLNETLLRSLGKVVFEDGAIVVQINQGDKE